MNEQERKAIFEISKLLADIEIYAGKIDFCNTNLMELVQLIEYDEYEERERPLYFWNNRERIEGFVEMQNDYYRGLLFPLIEKVQEQIELLIQNEKQ